MSIFSKIASCFSPNKPDQVHPQRQLSQQEKKVDAVARPVFGRNKGLELGLSLIAGGVYLITSTEVSLIAAGLVAGGGIAIVIVVAVVRFCSGKNSSQEKVTKPEQAKVAEKTSSQPDKTQSPAAMENDIKTKGSEPPNNHQGKRKELAAAERDQKQKIELGPKKSELQDPIEIRKEYLKKFKASDGLALAKFLLKTGYFPNPKALEILKSVKTDDRETLDLVLRAEAAVAYQHLDLARQFPSNTRQNIYFEAKKWLEDSVLKGQDLTSQTIYLFLAIITDDDERIHFENAEDPIVKIANSLSKIWQDDPTIDKEGWLECALKLFNEAVAHEQEAETDEQRVKAPKDDLSAELPVTTFHEPSYVAAASKGCWLAQEFLDSDRFDGLYETLKGRWDLGEEDEKLEGELTTLLSRYVPAFSSEKISYVSECLSKRKEALKKKMNAQVEGAKDQWDTCCKALFNIGESYFEASLRINKENDKEGFEMTLNCAVSFLSPLQEDDPQAFGRLAYLVSKGLYKCKSVSGQEIDPRDTILNAKKLVKTHPNAWLHFTLGICLKNRELKKAHFLEAVKHGLTRAYASLESLEESSPESQPQQNGTLILTGEHRRLTSTDTFVGALKFMEGKKNDSE